MMTTNIRNRSPILELPPEQIHSVVVVKLVVVDVVVLVDVDAIVLEE